MRPRVWFYPTPTTTKILLIGHSGEVLRATLPPPPRLQPRATPLLLEGLARWLDCPLSVALCVDEQADLSDQVLYDEVLFGASTLHYEIDLVDLARRRRGRGSFRDLRQLASRGVR